MSKRLGLLLLILGSMLITVPSHAEIRRSNYVATDEDTVVFAGNRRVVIGGTILRTPTRLQGITVDDLNGPGVGVFVCQVDESADNGDICGDGRNDASISFCSTGARKNLSTENFRPGSVYVRIDIASTICPTVGTVGKIAIDR